MKTGLALGLAATIALSPLAVAGEGKKKDMPEETMGFVEWVVLQDTGLRMKARLDTGAKTSSLHAVNVEPFKKGSEEWVSFQIPLADHQNMDGVKVKSVKKPENVVLEFERPVERTVLVKRKGASSQRRYVVRMDFCIGGSTHETQFSLADRSKFSYPALLGRRFLKDDNILVGSSDSFLAEKKCEYNELPEIVEQNER